MNDHPLISIIVPVFNTLEYLPECIQSLLQQSLSRLEFIFVDNGSTDGSYEYLLSVQTDHPEKYISVYRVEGGRQGRCRNFGIQKAKGEYIGFADSDDWCALDMFEKLYSEAIKYDADICFGRVKVADCVGGAAKDHYESKYFKAGLFNQYEKPFLTRMTACYNKIFRRAMLIENGIDFLEGVVHQDVTFNFKALCLAERICANDTANYFWRQHSASTTKKLNGVKSRPNEDVFVMIRALRSLECELGCNYQWRSAVNRLIESHLAHLSKLISADETSRYLSLGLDVAGFLPESSVRIVMKGDWLTRSESDLTSYIMAIRKFGVSNSERMHKYRSLVRIQSVIILVLIMTFAITVFVS